MHVVLVMYAVHAMYVRKNGTKSCDFDPNGRLQHLIPQLRAMESIGPNLRWFGVGSFRGGLGYQRSLICGNYLIIDMFEKGHLAFGVKNMGVGQN